jgi:hypothetical protein
MHGERPPRYTGSRPRHISPSGAHIKRDRHKKTDIKKKLAQCAVVTTRGGKKKQEEETNPRHSGAGAKKRKREGKKKKKQRTSDTAELWPPRGETPIIFM